MMSANRAGRKHASRNERSAARLAATQALYQIEMSESDAEEVLTEFIDHRLGGDPEVGLGMVCDENFFKDIVRGVLHHQTDIDSKLSASLASGWTLRRVDSILRALMRAAAYELMGREDVPVKVVIDEYVELAKDFFDGEEPAFVNAVLDRLAREGRA
jgi:N utilization substance protein B